MKMIPPADLFRLAVETWGYPAQMMMVIEEGAELILSIARKSRGRAGDEEIAEEVADLEIMCGQLRYMVGDDLVERHKAEKLARLQTRLEAAEAAQNKR